MAAEGETSSESLVLSGVYDHYGGVIVHINDNDPMDPATFLSLLTSSIAHWKLQGKRGVWIKLPIERVNLVEVAVKEGFWYHHAEPKYLMLVYWIPQSPHTIPSNATHRVGIGAFVLNPNTRQGEDICVAAVREVKEETGIDSEFVEVLAFRQSHKSFFEKSDLFFVCMMRPLSFDIQTQEHEIQAAQWIPFDEYAAQPFVQNNELLKYINDICKTKIDGQYSGFSPLLASSFYDEKASYLYLNNCSKAPKRDGGV